MWQPVAKNACRRGGKGDETGISQRISVLPRRAGCAKDQLRLECGKLMGRLSGGIRTDVVECALVVAISQSSARALMTILKASATIAGSAIVCAIAGTTIGFCLGRYFPGFYSLMFAHDVGPRYDPVEVGIGLGCVQGLIGGIVIGVVIVLAVTWHAIRIAEFQSRERDVSSP
jgi:hypothetical protein